MGSLGQLRYEPVDKRIRGVIGSQVVIDTDRALLVWEPKRVVPSYAVPAHELEGLTRFSCGGRGRRAGVIRGGRPAPWGPPCL